ncbi:hypothetical protein HDF17_002181 [Granulicella arctica]|uniref:Uncharacterized protein n=1 Tax=Granulicella arctica TaxID=940613 RepID=A0A7Y9PHC6_9BACT|nr:hypothetical protein [Granulicella arctica]
MEWAGQNRAVKQSTEMAKRIRMRYSKNNKVCAMCAEESV